MSLVSIIIPTYNRAHLIGETLDSVLAQTYLNWECIVVDDGSTDNTAELMVEYLENDSRFQYLHRPKDRLPGGNAARNYGFEVSKGDYIQWFDSDDIMLKNYISLRLEKFTDKLNLVICKGINVGHNLKEIHGTDLYIKENLYKDYVSSKCRIFTPSIIFKRQFLQHKELFNEEILRGQEADFFSDIFFELNKEEYVIIDKSLFYYRQHTQTKSVFNKSYIEKFKQDHVQFLIKNFKRSLLIKDEELQKVLYSKIVKHFFLAIENRSPCNCEFILHQIVHILKFINIYQAFKFYILAKFAIIINRKSYFFKKFLLNIKFH